MKSPFVAFLVIVLLNSWGISSDEASKQLVPGLNSTGRRDSSTKDKNTISLELHSATDSIDIPQWIVDTLSSFPEIKGLGAALKTAERKDSSVLFMGDFRQDTVGSSYYYVQVGENNDFAFITHYTFFVYPGSKRILFYDVVNDTTIRLDTWRKNSNQPSR